MTSGVPLAPGAIIGTHLIKYHYVVLHTNFKDSKPSSLTQEFVLCFAYINLCKTCDPMAGPFLTQGTFNKLGRGLLDGNTY